MPTKPLSLGLLDEGRFLVEADQDLAAIQRELTGYVAKYGKDLAKGAEAELTLRVVVRFDGKDATDYSVQAISKKVIPARPPTVSKAISAGVRTVDDDGLLWVQASGSSADTPRQQKLCTDDGRAIDAETGEAAPAGA